MKNKKWKKIIVIESIILITIASLFPICIGRNSDLIKHTTNISSSNEGALTLVTCSIFTFAGFKTVTKEVPLEKWKEINKHLCKIQDNYNDKSLYTHIQEKAILLTSKLYDLDLLPNKLDLIRIFEFTQVKSIYFAYLSHILRNSQMDSHQNSENSTINYFNFIYGEGRNGECYDLKGAIVVGSIWQLILLRILFPNFFQVLTNCLLKRPRVFVGYGHFNMENGGNVKTIGLSGIKNLSCKDCSLVVTLQGFIGLIVCSVEESYIFGFSLASGLYI